MMAKMLKMLDEDEDNDYSHKDDGSFEKYVGDGQKIVKAVAGNDDKGNGNFGNDDKGNGNFDKDVVMVDGNCQGVFIRGHG